MCFIWGAYYLIGKIGSLKANDLLEQQRDDIKKYGLVHWTTSENADSIIKKKTIKASDEKKSYSNDMRKSAHFLYAKNMGKDRENEDLNVSIKSDTYIIVKDLDDEQVSKCKCRAFDKVILYEGDFCLKEFNTVIRGSVKRKKRRIFTRKDILYTVEFIVVGSIGFLMAPALWLIEKKRKKHC